MNDVKKVLNECLKRIGLDENWVLSITALSAQEVALRKKLDEMNIESGEEDFQKLGEMLQKAYENKGLQFPLITLSIVRAYRHIRAKLLHEGHRYPISERELEQLVMNTNTFITELFPTTREESSFFDQVCSSSESEMRDIARRLSLDEAKQAQAKLLDKLSLTSYSEWSNSDDKLVQFIGVLIKSKEKDEERIVLFDELIEWYLRTTAYLAKSRITRVVAELARSLILRERIFYKKGVEKIILDYANSNSYDEAGRNAELVACIAPDLDSEQLKKVLDAAKSNDQILCSYSARPHILNIIAIAESKIGKEATKPIQEALKQT
ncbi:MAG: hypothetical protein QXI42_03525 [Thermoproteota archaeon]|nr:hypothetical protein [Candidatus Brockarchaeota archaeon]